MTSEYACYIHIERDKTYVCNYRYIALFTVAAQDIVIIAHPGQDVEIVCGIGSGANILWRINESSSVHSLNDLFNGAVAGHTINGSNIVVEDIMMNDVRNGSQYRCEIVQVPPNPNIMGNVTILYVAGEYKVSIIAFYLW